MPSEVNQRSPVKWVGWSGNAIIFQLPPSHWGYTGGYRTKGDTPKYVILASRNPRVPRRYVPPPVLTASGMGHDRSKGQRDGHKLAYSTTCMLDPHSMETHAITIASPLGIGVRTLPPFARTHVRRFFCTKEFGTPRRNPVC